MFRIHVPHRDWLKGQIIEAHTISDVIEEIWKILPEIVNQEHIIIECDDQPHINTLEPTASSEPFKCNECGSITTPVCPMCDM